MISVEYRGMGAAWKYVSKYLEPNEVYVCDARNVVRKMRKKRAA